MPDPLLVPWRGHLVRIRHHDPMLEPYAPSAAVIGSAMQLASDELGLQLVLDATVGDRYVVIVAERPDGVLIGLRRN